MAGTIVDGNGIAEKIKLGLQKEIELLKAQGKSLKLASLLAGENPASKVYIANQQKFAAALGVDYRLLNYPDSISENELLAEIGKLNTDDTVRGLIVQMPLPPGLDPGRVQRAISPKKDVEGIHPENLGKLVLGELNIVPATAASVWEIVKQSGVQIKGKEAVIVGHSSIVGKPAALLFLSSLLESATTTVCHIATRELKAHTLRADILVVAVGKAGFIGPEYVKKGAFVIDVGINRVPVLDEKGAQVIDDKGRKKMKTVGDVDYESVKDIAGIITPVPGGVGPLTVVMLLKNLVNLSH